MVRFGEVEVYKQLKFISFAIKCQQIIRKNKSLDVMCKLCANKKSFQDLILESLDFTSGPTWARTRDHLIMSQVL